MFHDFRAASDDQAQDELTNFLKNTVILGGALVLFALSTTPWRYALGVGPF